MQEPGLLMNWMKASVASVGSKAGSAVRSGWAGEVGKGQFREGLIGRTGDLGFHPKCNRPLKICKMDNNTIRFAF